MTNKLYLSIVIILLLSACHNRKALNREAMKMAPYDFLEMTRNYPEFKTDIRAFRQTLEQARTTHAKRSGKFGKSWTLEGPGNIGGRFNCVEIDPADHRIMYAGSACGGLFKTTDNGNSWVPVFDTNAFLSIGCIAIDPSNTDIIYAGTGDPAMSGSAFTGNGVYKSLNAGKTWTSIGLTETGIVSKLVIHPSDPQVIYAATMGFVMRRDSSRGLYKSTNGGNSWKRIFSLGEETGIIDLVLDKNNPETLYAAGMLRIRTNLESSLSSDRARVYKTTDGGSNWEMLQTGFPNGRLSRINLDIFYKGTSSHLYASVVDTSYEMLGIYKSLNNGVSWTSLNTSDIPANALGGFGWYFGHIKVNPFVEDELYFLGVDMYKTTNGGSSWELACPEWFTYEVHADKHDLKFVSADTLLLATDGGLYRSIDRSVQWADIENIPVTQFYKVAYNPWEPDMYYGGAQDNGTSAGNAQMINEWYKMWGGDGFTPAFNPELPEIRYYSTQNGRIYQYNTDQFKWKLITTASGEESDSNERFNWDTPYKISNFNASIVYYASHRLFRYDDNVEISFEMSGDLTDGNIYGPKFHTVSTIAESHFKQGELFIGTSDGNVRRTLNDGGNWTSISNGLPKRYVSAIRTSPNNDSTVYVTFTGYKYNEWIPHVFKSTDKGNSWKNISGNLPNWAVNDILPIQGNDSLLFVATDGGVYGSFDNGVIWERVGKDMPVCPVYSLVVNPSQKTLAAGTHARSLMSYPISDLLEKPVGIHPANVLAGMEIYPNPVSHTLELKNIPCDNLTYRVYDMNGKIYHSGILQSTGTVDVKKLKSGPYFIELRGGGSRITRKFVKAD